MKKILVLSLLFCIVNAGRLDVDKCNLADTPLGQLIGKYESKNNYTIANKIVNKKVIAIKDLPLTDMTLQEIRAKQRLGSSTLWATGRFQVVSGTLEDAINGLKLDRNLKYNKYIQDKIFTEFLIGSNNTVVKYLFGESDNVKSAGYYISKIWASMPVPSGYTTQGGRTSSGQNAFYDSDGVNPAYSEITFNVMQDALEKTREQVMNGKCVPAEYEQPNNDNPNDDTGNNSGSNSNTGDYDDDIGDNVNVGGNVGSACGGCVSILAIETSTKTSLLNFKSMERQTARAINSIIDAIYYAHQDLEKQNENLAKQTQKLMEEENLIQKELLYNKIRINKLQDLINTKKAEE